MARRQPPIRAGYEHLRLERQGALVSRKTLEYYDGMVLPFLTWLESEGVERFEHLDVTHARQYRARLASVPGRHGRVRQPDTLRSSHRAIGVLSPCAGLRAREAGSDDPLGPPGEEESHRLLVLRVTRHCGNIP